MQLTSTADTATAVAGKATIHKDAGIITSEALTTGSGSQYTLTLGCSQVTAQSLVMVSVQNGSNTGGLADVLTVTPSNGQVVILVNNNGGAVFNGTIIISVIVFN